MWMAAAFLFNDMSDPVLLGYVARTFGVKGGVVVKLLNEQSQALTVGKSLRINKLNGQEDGLIISECLPGHRVFFAGITTKSMADELKGSQLFIDRADLADTDDSEFYLHDLLGARVVKLNGDSVGEVVGFSDNNAQYLLNVKTDAGHVASIPVVKP